MTEPQHARPSPADVPDHVPGQRRFHVGLGANLVAGVWSAAAAFLTLPIAARWIGLEAFALLGLFQVVQMAVQVCDLGLSPLISRELAASRAGSAPADERTLVVSLEAVYGAIGAVLAVAFVAGGPIIAARWAHTSSLAPRDIIESVALMALVLAVNWPVTFYVGGLQGVGAQVPASILQIIATTLGQGGGLVVLATVSPTVRTWFAWQLVVSVARTLGLRYLLWRRLRGPGRARVAVDVIRRHWRFSLGLTLTYLPAILLSHDDKLSIAWLSTPATFATYYLAATVGLSMAVVIGPLYASLLPRFATAVSARSNVAATFEECGQLAACVIVPASIVLASLARSVVWAWTGDAALTSTMAPVVAIVVLGNMVSGMAHVPYALQVAWQWTRAGIVLYTGTLIVTLPIVVWAALHDRPILVATVSSAAFAIIFAGNLINVRRRLDYSIVRWLWRCMGPSVAAGLSGVGLALLLPSPVSRWAHAATCAVALALALSLATALTPSVRALVFAAVRVLRRPRASATQHGRGA